MQRRFAVISILALLVAALPATLGAHASAQAGNGLKLSAASGGTRGPLTGPAARAMARGPLAFDEETLARQKAAAAADVSQAAPVEPSAVTANPVILVTNNGLSNGEGAPSDSTGAVGPTRYIENVNSKAGIYRRSDLTLLASSALDTWWGEAGANSFDPQVMWDATSNRFFYAGDAVFSDSDNRLAFGFSKSATPTDFTSASWCQYQVSYGSEFPDYPKLGDSRYFALIGVNTFGPTTFRGSDLIAIGKPGAATITTCPDPTTFKFGNNKNLKVGTTVAFTPVPATSVDTNANGWAVTRPASVPASSLGLFKVTRDSTTGQPVFAGGVSIPVSSYDIPAAAPQKGTTIKIDTSDTRLTQAVAAIDPGHGNTFAIWTQHTIKGGAGSKVRWYEIDPVAKTLLQTGNVFSSSLWYYNGAISPDRKVLTGSTSEYGSNMLLNFSASSATAYTSIRMVSKRGANDVSGVVLVKLSSGPNIDFACQPNCRWGDYAAATPDPSAPTGQPSGVVWSTNMWNVGGTSTSGNAVWRTRNWSSRP